MDVTVKFSYRQDFELRDDKPDNETIFNDFGHVDFRLEPDAPFEWSVSEIKVYKIEICDDFVSRDILATIKIHADESCSEFQDFASDFDYDYGSDVIDWDYAIMQFVDHEVYNKEYASFLCAEFGKR